MTRYTVGPQNNHQLKRHFENIPVAEFVDSREASAAAAREISELIQERESQGRTTVLGLATGSSPVTVYEELVRLHREEGLSFKNCITFNLDEYWPMEPESIQSYVRFMREHLFDHIDIDPAHIHIPDGTIDREEITGFCTRYEKSIDDAGGIDLQLLGIGRTGHIGFNEPGSPPDSTTRKIFLDQITRSDAASDFFGEENVPMRALTMGIGSIKKAGRIILLAWGEGKAPILRRTVEGPLSASVPATYLKDHPDTIFIIDRAAASELTVNKTPWLAGPCEWNDRRHVRRAVVWLCEHLKKPILKLTDEDYRDNGMGDLLANDGPAYRINLEIFDDLMHTITGWPGGKPFTVDQTRPVPAEPYPKRIIIFSPHPDDDVIAMGGTLLHLVDQGHDVHVAYQTSGSIAVFDDDVIRFADFVASYESEFGINTGDSALLFREMRSFLLSKQPAQVDSPEVLTVKTLIRRTEARSACRFVGIPESNIHFLDLPFYETGTVKKKKLGKEDVAIISEMIRRIKPHQIYAAGDLSDPHGTHRVCLQAVLRALDETKEDDFMSECTTWLYRGAWQEWGLGDADMAVPLSPDELSRKRRAIFKHQSQKDRPLFPGPDTREFWQRSEARNRGTAKLYDSLGFPEYEAMEIFKKYIPDT